MHIVLQTSRLWHSCCIKWPFFYPIWCLYYLWTVVQLSYVCNQGGTASFFLSRLVCCILDVANKHGITLYCSMHTYHLSVETNYLSCSQLNPEWHLLPHIAQATFQSVSVLLYQSVSALLHLRKSPPSGSLGVECFE